MNEIDIFAERYFSEYKYELVQSLLFEITSKSKEYILNVDQEKFIDALQDKYQLEEISISFENKKILEPEKVTRGSYTAYEVTVSFLYTGSDILLKMMPGNRSVTSYPIKVSTSTKTLFGKFEVKGKDQNLFNQQLSNMWSQMTANIENLNKEVKQWNNQLRDTILQSFTEKKKEYISDNDFFEAIGVSINKETEMIFNPLTIKKKVIPLPIIKDKDKKFHNAPVMNPEMYNDILEVVNSVCKSMEKKPSTYRDKDEEGLRDHILTFLETRYESTTATGETFNKSGKTDILLKYSKDNSNLFVAECKFWHGIKEFFEATNQLLGYLTWRDSKTALILFVQNKDISKVTNTIKQETPKHPNYSNFVKETDESSISYIFHLPGDPDKKILLEVMIFHFP